jgi:hypothetical protein
MSSSDSIKDFRNPSIPHRGFEHGEQNDIDNQAAPNQWRQPGSWVATTCRLKTLRIISGCQFLPWFLVGTPTLVRKSQICRYENPSFDIHSSLAGKTRLGLTGEGVVTKINLKNYTWKSYCGGRFSVPVPA